MTTCTRCGSKNAYISLVVLPKLGDTEPPLDYCATCYDFLSAILAMFNTDGAIAITPGDMAMECGAES